MTKAEYEYKLKSLHPQFDCDLRERLRSEYISSLESQVETLTAENVELRTRIEYIETKTEELHKAFYGYDSCNDSAEFVLDNVLLDIDPHRRRRKDDQARVSREYQDYICTQYGDKNA